MGLPVYSHGTVTRVKHDIYAYRDGQVQFMEIAACGMDANCRWSPQWESTEPPLTSKRVQPWVRVEGHEVSHECSLFPIAMGST